MEITRNAHFLAPLLGASAAEAALRLERDNILVASTIEGAFESAARNRGLLGRDAIAENSAMVIAPSNGIHTWFMRFPIDVVFAARDGRVLKIVSAMRPWRIAFAWGAFAVVELGAGTVERRGIRTGDRFVIA